MAADKTFMVFCEFQHKMGSILIQFIGIFLNFKIYDELRDPNPDYSSPEHQRTSF